MIDKIQKSFTDNHIDINILVRSLQNSFAAKSQRIYLFENDLFQNVNPSKRLFEVLDDYWNVYDCDLLKFLVSKANCEESTKIFAEFLDTLNSVDFSAIDLADYKCSVRAPNKVLQIKLKESKCTIEILKKIKIAITECFGLTENAITFKEVRKGCINICFQVQDLVAVYISQQRVPRDCINQLKEVADITVLKVCCREIHIEKIAEEVS